MFRTLLISTVAVFGCATTALAEPVQTNTGFYVQGSLGSGFDGKTTLSVRDVGSLHEDLKSGLFASVAVGESFANGFAIESELLNMDNNIKASNIDQAFGVDTNPSVRTFGVMVNAHYAFVPIGPFTAHVGGGIGVGSSKYKILGASESKNEFMWQLMAGASYPVTKQASLDLSYRFVESPRFNETVDVGGTDFGLKLETETHVIAAGLRYKF
jgi:opacity protein-like surface antigen